MVGGSASSSSSAALCSSDMKRHDVFISFRGMDTRRNVASLLYDALCQNQIQAYEDGTTVEKEDEVGPALTDLTDESHVKVCVGDPKDSFSCLTWCLEELKEAKIAYLGYNFDYFDLSHVWKHTGSYKKTLQKHEKDCRLDEGIVKNCRDCLGEESCFCGSESEFKDYYGSLSDEVGEGEGLSKIVLDKVHIFQGGKKARVAVSDNLDYLGIGSCKRSLISEEVLHNLQHHQSPSSRNQIGRYQARVFQLCFRRKLCPSIFTLSMTTNDDEGPLKLVLLDATSNQYPVVTGDPLSSIKIEICVLDGEFESDGTKDWNIEEFNASILWEIDDKGTLLSGGKLVPPRKSVGYFTKLVFADNSSWMRSQYLESKVKRISAYEKIDRPSLDDSIWRLKKIAKHGKIHMQLSYSGIKTMKELLLSYKTNASLQGQKMVLLEETSKNPPPVATSVPQLYEKEHVSLPKINIGKPATVATLNGPKRKEEMAQFSSSLVTLTFPLLLFSMMFMNPLNKTHGSNSILLALLAMFNFMAFTSAVSIMITIGAQFTKIQMILLVISAMAMHVAAPSLLFMLVEVPVLMILIMTM